MNRLSTSNPSARLGIGHIEIFLCSRIIQYSFLPPPLTSPHPEIIVKYLADLGQGFILRHG